MERVSAREAFELVNQGYRYLDVRSVPEFEGGHPSGAYNVPLLHLEGQGMVRNSAFVAQVRALVATDVPLVIGCASGVRSLEAARLLAEAGYARVVDQRAGMEGVKDPFGRVKERGWRAEGLPVSSSAEPGHSHREIAALSEQP